MDTVWWIFLVLCSKLQTIENWVPALSVAGSV